MCIDSLHKNQSTNPFSSGAHVANVSVTSNTLVTRSRYEPQFIFLPVCDSRGTCYVFYFSINLLPFDRRVTQW